MGNYLLLFPVFFPIICCIFMPFLKKQRQKELIVPLLLAVEIIVVFMLAFGQFKEIEVWRISSLLSISFSNDGLSRLYSCLISVIWFLALFFQWNI